MDSETHDSTAARRRRKVGRSMREQTPDAPHTSRSSDGRRRYFEDDSSQLDATTSPAEDASAQLVRMQIRPPGTISAHESKILRRRDKAFDSAAARSHSQPRQAERLSSPEAFDLMRTAKRSLSSPRHKEESDESELTAGRRVSPSAPAGERTRGLEPVADENISRLGRNLRRFEEERKRFEAEKRHFEREKTRYKQLHDNEERKRLLQSYRKLSDRIQLPLDASVRRRMVQSLRLQPNEVQPAVRRRNRHSGYDESSTQFSSSDGEEANAKRLAHQLSPVRRNVSSASAHVVSVRGPPPQPPEPADRRPISRNNSLSPIRPARRSKTPEQRVEAMRKLGAEHSAHESNTLPPTQLQGLAQRREIAPVAKENANSASKNVERRESLKRDSFSSQAKDPAPVNRSRTVESVDASLSASPEVHCTAGPEDAPVKKSTGFFGRIFSRFKKPPHEAQPKDSKSERKEPPEVTEGAEHQQKLMSTAFVRQFCREASLQWRRLKADYPQEAEDIRRLRNKCVSHAIVLIMLCGFGGLMFRYTEGTSENIYKCEVRKVKRDFIDHLWTGSHNMREDDWKSLARQKLRTFEEELHALQELGIRRYPGMKSWNFVNCILYCWTVITTIGYGHITPHTPLGQSLTIVYAIIGIPMFLILLADFGKLFTRGMKFIWAYVRRLYYTGTCRNIRKQQQVRDAMTGFNTVYDMAIRRPSQFFGMGPESDIESEPGKSIGASHPDTPTSPYPETFEIDDEFNLPVSLASILLISYILIGALMYHLWEEWTYFEAFYFVFISMSTIGFGDLVPNHPIFMMCTMIYLVFGLALTSMFINVVQIKLSDTFKQASDKLGATIGFGLASELGDDGGSQLRLPSELASVHGSRLGKISEHGTDPATAASSPMPGPQLQSILRAARPVSPLVHVNRPNDGSDPEHAPPLLPRRQVSMEPKGNDREKKKKRRFFK